MIPDSELLFSRPSTEKVLADLTDFFYTDELQKQQRVELELRKQAIGILRDKGREGNIEVNDIADVLQYSEHALNAIISILGISQEGFLNIFMLKTIGKKETGTKMGIATIRSNIRRDRDFAVEVARLLLSGHQDPELINRVPPFQLEKMNKQKLLLKRAELIDSLLRQGLKGRYDAKKGGILEDHIEEILIDIGVQYVRGEICLPSLSRNLDFVVPNTETPYILIESGIFETTARELSDKARVEKLGLEEIEKQYPDARFVRVTDGIGWKRRGGEDLRNLIQASHYFLVFRTLRQLENIVKHHVPEDFFKT